MHAEGSAYATMVDRLRRRGFVRSDPVEQALRSVPRRRFLAEACSPMVGMDGPIPMIDPLLQAPPSPSPRVVSVLLEALELEPGHRVLVRGQGVAWIGALVAHIVDHGRVRVEEVHDGLREAALGVGPEIAPELPALNITPALEGPSMDWDRILVLEAPGGSAGGRDELVRALDELGLLLRVDPGPMEPELHRLVQTGGETAAMQLGGARAGDPPPGAAPQGTEDGVSVSQALRLETLLADAWLRSGQDATAQGLREAVEETIGRALDARGLRDEHPTPARAAEAAFQIGYVHQMAGEGQAADDAYTASAEILPTAEAYTFRGWARSFEGDIQSAIEDCERAIEVDPTLGNPYNDIGAYLLELDKPEAAIDWLEQATEAERYASPVFPYLNLGRAYAMLGREAQAREALEQALRIEPGYEPAQELLRRLGDQA